LNDIFQFNTSECEIQGEEPVDEKDEKEVAIDDDMAVTLD